MRKKQDIPGLLIGLAFGAFSLFHLLLGENTFARIYFVGLGIILAIYTFIKARP